MQVYSTQNPLNLLFNACQIIQCKVRTNSYYYIACRRKPILMKTKRLAEESFYAVSTHSFPHFTLHTDPQTTFRWWANCINYTQPLAVPSLSPFIDTLKITLFFQPLLWGKRVLFRAHADNRLRPLARLRLITACPARVLMRTKKPWVLERLVQPGWKVLLLIIIFP